MSGPGPAALPPIPYTETCLKNIWSAGTAEEVERAFELFFSPDVQATLNGGSVSRDNLYKLFKTQDLEGSHHHTSTVTFKDVVATSLIPGPSGEIVGVGAFVTVDFKGRCLFFSHTTSQLTVSINVVLEERDEFRLEGLDSRRATYISMIVVDQHNKSFLRDLF